MLLLLSANSSILQIAAFNICSPGPWKHPWVAGLSSYQLCREQQHERDLPLCVIQPEHPTTPRQEKTLKFEGFSFAIHLIEICISQAPILLLSLGLRFPGLHFWILSKHEVFPVLLDLLVAEQIFFLFHVSHGILVLTRGQCYYNISVWYFGVQSFIQPHSLKHWV